MEAILEPRWSLGNWSDTSPVCISPDNKAGNLVEKSKSRFRNVFFLIQGSNTVSSISSWYASLLILTPEYIKMGGARRFLPTERQISFRRYWTMETLPGKLYLYSCWPTGIILMIIRLFYESFSSENGIRFQCRVTDGFTRFVRLLNRTHLFPALRNCAYFSL